MNQKDAKKLTDATLGASKEILKAMEAAQSMLDGYNIDSPEEAEQAKVFAEKLISSKKDLVVGLKDITDKVNSISK